MKLEVLSPLGIAHWKKIFELIPEERSSVFHSPEYVLSWQKYEDAEPLCLHLEEDGFHFLYTFMRKPITGYECAEGYFDVSSPYGHGGLISSGEATEAIIKEVNRAIDEWCVSEKIVAEFIREHPCLPQLRNCERRHVRTNLLFEYGSGEWESLISKHGRRDAASAEKKGCVTEIDEELATLPGFMELYQKLCEEKNFGDFYRFDESYFAELKRFLQTWSFIINVKKDGMLAASALFFRRGTEIIYHLSAADLACRQYLATDLVLRTAISHGAGKGCRRIFWGGGLTSKDDDALYRFKEKFATSTAPVQIGTKLHAPVLYKKLCDEWAARNPDKVTECGHFFLRYRM
ncbi:MAG: hypothetical protein A2X49_03555 [Lentisphaerae bacterium GWF2_52_8]|nr:MAG: hypothetical protein A2X49_03555 [Lentisphaerae bacterium GWF2_52_8]